MGFKCGIVGLPNVGKSTLFNALTKTAAAQAANYPFCTIEPNTGEVAVPDSRMRQIADIAGSKELIPTRINFVDIAGLVRGASKGEGLGNQFLANIREVDAIVHVLRCFEDDDITHVEGRIDPVSDAQTVETELMLSDLESLERRIVQIRKRATGKDKEATTVLPMMEESLTLLQNGEPVRMLLKGIAPDDLLILKGLNLLTSKPVLYVCNVAESDAANGNEHTEAVAKMAKEQGAETVIISAAIEAEVSQLPDEDAQLFLGEMGLEEPGLDRLIRAGYSLLDLITYFTAGPKETRAWTVHRGAKAPQAAGVIHTDFERGFIRAQTIAFNDYVTFKGEVGAKEAGKARDE
ncbi:redox-regulated ATPase YchF, partial [Pseudochrobactrum sp. AO18b]|uniref:redox-regulated ATPase YchF n=1 Tax=Pseudochrobactrum sp. AO18b TaxID=1201036 RepID=UPI0003B38A23